MYTYIYMYTYKQTYIYIYICIYVCIHIYEYMHVWQATTPLRPAKAAPRASGACCLSLSRLPASPPLSLSPRLDVGVQHPPRAPPSADKG